MRYGAARRSNPEPPSSQNKWRSRKHDDRCYPRESQESPWEDEYTNDPEHIYYTAGKRPSKQRPSSASEIDRKTGEIKSKHFLQTGRYITSSICCVLIFSFLSLFRALLSPLISFLMCRCFFLSLPSFFLFLSFYLCFPYVCFLHLLVSKLVLSLCL